VSFKGTVLRDIRVYAAAAREIELAIRVPSKASWFFSAR